MSYTDTVLATRAQNLLAYYPGNELSGTVAYDLSGNAHNGVYSGVALGQPGFEDDDVSVFYPGSVCSTDIYSAGLASVFNGQELSILLWCKTDLATWTDGVSRRWFTIQITTGNRILFQKNATTGLSVSYIAGGVNKTRSKTTIVGETGWVCLLLTASKTANEMKLYINGVQEGATLTGLGAWAGVLAPTSTAIGVGSLAPSQITHGWISNVAIWNQALTAEDAVVLAEPTVQHPSVTFEARARSLTFEAQARPLTFYAREP